MSGSREATQALQAAAIAAYDPAKTAGGALQKAVRAVLEASDIMDALQASVDVVVAVEALHDATDVALKLVRGTLAQQMDATGATTIAASFHTAHLARKPAFVSINDESVIPPEYVEQRPHIDKRAIAAAIKNGTEVAGASLLQPNDQTLVLRAKKETPQ